MTMPSNRTTSGFFSRPADPSVITEAERLAPANPFMTSGYLAAQAALGFQCHALGLANGDEVTAVTFGFLRRGRLNTGLEITSALPVEDGSPFWKGLGEFCHEFKVSRLTVNSFSSSSTDIPSLGRELDRYSRSEFVIDLTVPELMDGVSKSHRERIRKARKQGVELRHTTSADELGLLTDLHNASMVRRQSKGEDAPLQAESRELRAFLASGCGELFQAVRGDETLGSIFVLRARNGAYSCSSGNSPEGMKCGASHFLTFETALWLKAQGLSVFNRSGARPAETGLRDFKQRFGAREVELESAAFDLSGPVRRSVTRLAAMAGLQR